MKVAIRKRVRNTSLMKSRMSMSINMPMRSLREEIKIRTMDMIINIRSIRILRKIVPNRVKNHKKK
jgi:hypothetical protein